MGVQRIKQLAEGFRNDYSISIISRTCHIVPKIPLSPQFLTANRSSITGNILLRFSLSFMVQRRHS